MPRASRTASRVAASTGPRPPRRPGRRSRMPRRQSIPRKAKYQQESNRVTDRFRAKLMRDGKQTLSDRILRQALARAEFQAKRPGLEVLEAALRNATPIIEVKPRRVGGATYHVPVEIRREPRLSVGGPR